MHLFAQCMDLAALLLRGLRTSCPRLRRRKNGIEFGLKLLMNGTHLGFLILRKV